MNYLAITNFRCLTDLTEEDFEGDALENRIIALKKELEELLKAHDFNLKVVDSTFLHRKKYSISECSKCRRLMIDRDTNPIGYEGEFIGDIVANGGNIDGKIVCEECLPKGHRWSILG